MKRLAIINGRVVDPASGLDGSFDIVAMGGRIASVKPAGAEKVEGSKDWVVVDAEGMLVLPGLVDIHVHLREPGEEYKETIASGARAAAAGGFTSICCMANTEPVNDNSSVTRYILKKAAEEAVVRLYPIGAVSMGLKGERLTEMADLVDAGCVAVSDDGMPLRDPSLMRHALEYSKTFAIPLISHAEEPALVAGGSMNEGAVSTRLGLKGIPSAAEDVMVARDICLAELTGAHLHIAHVSTLGAVDMIRAAKERGVNVTAEATPHHLSLDDTALSGYDANAKMNPPLRSVDDVEALIEGLASGVIDAVATDHAPHSSVEKDVEFDCAANGIVGLETALGIVLGLVEAGKLDLSEAIAAMTVKPAKIVGIDAGKLSVGSSADIAIVDPEAEWRVEPENFLSKSRNTPFAGMKFKGRVVKTLLDGKCVFSLDD